MTGWQTLGRIAPEDLVEARLELHHAAQLPAIAVGRWLVPQRADDSNTSFVWDPEEGSWLGSEIPDSGSGGVRAGLRAADLTLLLTRGDGERRELPLIGKTLNQGLAWTKQTLGELGVDAGKASLEAHYEIPDHPVKSGRPFDVGLLTRFSEIGAYFHNSFLLLREIVEADADAEPISIWPHLFDIATVITLSSEGEEARTIGVGMTPGDEHYPVPYLYVTPWPYPKGHQLPDLPGGGGWHLTGWVGAVLQAPRLTEVADGSGQEQRAREFLSAAVTAARSLIDPG